MRREPLLLVLLALAGCDLSEEDRSADDRPAAQAPVTGDGRLPEAAPPAREDAGGPFAAVPEIVERVRPSVVAVFAQGPAGEGEGSGVIFDGDGLIVTNLHVVEGGEEVQVELANGQRLPARVRAADERTDLAILAVSRDGLPAARIADDLPRVGELAIALGNPLGFESSVTAGIVSGLDRAIPTGGQTPALVGLIQTDAAISPGNSGGALLDASGRVIGINVAYLPPEGGAVAIGFAIPAPVVRDVLSDLLDDGRVDHAFLGVTVTPLTPAIAERFGIDADGGAIVAEVSPGTPAAEAGLRRGDVIVRAGEREVRAVEDFYAALRQSDPGDELELTVVRDGERVSGTARLVERPAP